MISLREFVSADWPAVWKVMEPIIRSGTTYALSPAITEQEARRIWVDLPFRTYLAEEAGTILGTYYLKPNQPAQGAHVCNCGYMVAAHARGQGMATRMCEHSQKEAVRLGFRAMQYNLVVSTNVAAIRLWRKLGFEIVGVLPGAFQHPQQGYVDALVMYKQLVT